ncbi:MAG: PQQ-like beta-propeller repeat protein [Bryobacterales bacterium]|nr:PQQ-like beta-propeller repeat protein [Bryobacterales bacterium]
MTRRRSDFGPASQFSLLAVALLLISCISGDEIETTSDDYTQWRGPRSDGSASEFVEPSRWPDELKLEWTVEIGEGYATPLVIGEVVYAFVRREDHEGLVALEANTGDELWQSGYSAPYEPGEPAAVHGAGPKATPVYRNGKLFTVGISGIVAAFDASGGELLWRTDAPAEPPYFGAASSPIADKGVVIAHPGNYGPLTAFGSETGDVEWTAGAGGFFASPIFADIEGVRQVISVTQEGVIGVSFPGGTLLWQHPWKGDQGGPTPVLHGDTVIVSGNQQGVAAFKPVRNNGEWSTETVWETTAVSMYTSTPVVIADTLYGLSQRARGQYFALDVGSGGVLWLGQPRAALNTAVVKAGKLLLLLNDDAELVVARSNRARFDVVGRYSVAESATWAQPAVSGKRVFVKDIDSLTLWTVD